jgi:hypothetical protein
LRLQAQPTSSRSARGFLPAGRQAAGKLNYLIYMRLQVRSPALRGEGVVDPSDGNPKKDLNEFKRIYKKEFGEKLTDEEAQRIASNLISLFEIICQPLPNKIDRDKPEITR